jgi:hypothetical protein
MNSRILAVAAIMVVAVACNKNHKDASPETDAFAGVSPTPCNTCGQTKTTVVFPADTVINGTLSLCPDKTYILAGKMWINNGGKIVIPAGTVIKGRKNATPATASALVVTKGGKIEANGSPTCPVIFTSESDSTGGTPKPGDWGGVVVLGRSKINVPGGSAQIEGITSAPAGVSFTYGGTDTCDNSGFIRYTRIQYAGAVVATDNELNGLTLGGVGNLTELNHIEVYRGADDGFEFFGGTVGGKYLLSVSNNDDQFDFDLGYRGTLQYLVAILQTGDSVYSNNNTNGIECDNDATGSGNLPLTRPVISHLTIAGPGLVNGACIAQTPWPLLNAARFRRNTRFVLRNSVLYNFPTGIRLDDTVPASVDLLDTCGTNVNKSYFFDNVLSACSTPYTGWVTNPTGQNVANSTLLRLNSPNVYANFFNATEGLRPITATSPASPAGAGARYCGLTPLFCGFTFNNTLSIKGGAVDATNAYWLNATWIQQ